MTAWLKRKPSLLFAPGLAAGLLLFGAGMWIGSLAADRPDHRALLRETVLHAAATHGSEAFAMATGQVDEDMEGVFFLDGLTGELQCWVLSPRTGKFQNGGLFKANIAQDLGFERGKKPNYLLVTGRATFTGGGASNVLGLSVVYVVDVNSGNMAVYGVPWNRNLAKQAQLQRSPLVMLDHGKARSLELRE